MVRALFKRLTGHERAPSKTIRSQDFKVNWQAYKDSLPFSQYMPTAKISAIQRFIQIVTSFRVNCSTQESKSDINA